MKEIISIKDLGKIYQSGFVALKNINLSIKQGEIFALLGPNGAGKTTLISTICGLVNASSGSISISGHDHVLNYKEARSFIGLVPQEITRDAFETVWNTVKFSRALFGLKKDDALLDKILKDLSLDDKKNNMLMTLSGGMKRRVMIAKALSHEPKILFLDEPTAGVDVELRKSMWNQIRKLKEGGVTIILTTHYLEEAEEMADRIGIISNGELILTDDKSELMKKLGKKELIFHLSDELTQLPEELANLNIKLVNNSTLIYYYDQNVKNDISSIILLLEKHKIKYKDINTLESSLEDIFVELVKND